MIGVCDIRLLSDSVDDLIFSKCHLMKITKEQLVFLPSQQNKMLLKPENTPLKLVKDKSIFDEPLVEISTFGL